MNVIVTAFLTAARAFCSVLFWGLDSWKNRITLHGLCSITLELHLSTITEAKSDSNCACAIRIRRWSGRELTNEHSQVFASYLQPTLLVDPDRFAIETWIKPWYPNLDTTETGEAQSALSIYFFKYVLSLPRSSWLAALFLAPSQFEWSWTPWENTAMSS